MTNTPTAGLIERAQHHLVDAETGWLDAHGLVPVLRQTEDALERRKSQARRLLVMGHVVEELESVIGRGSVVVLKGAEVAALYPDPTLRPSRDLDLLVRDPVRSWHDLRAKGYQARPDRRLDIDHHHLPPLTDPSRTLGIELHVRPNAPTWARLGSSTVFETAVESRIPGWTSLRPSDDVHALLMALHAWKGGFTRLRDVLDAMLLAEASQQDVATTAKALGLHRLWSTTVALADQLLLGGPLRSGRAVTKLVTPGLLDARQRTRVRMLAPLAVAAPWRVASAHIIDVRLARAARRSPPGPTPRSPRARR